VGGNGVRPTDTRHAGEGPLYRFTPHLPETPPPGRTPPRAARRG
jgi:hypothetical protein